MVDVGVDVEAGAPAASRRSVGSFLELAGSRLLYRAVLILALVVVSFVAGKAWGVGPYYVAGVTDGSIYALAALGLVITYKTSGIFNFAQGGLGAAGAYVFYTFRAQEHYPWPVAVLLSAVIVGLGGGLVLERLGSWLSDAPLVMKVVATVGVLVLLESVLSGIYGASTLQATPFLPSRTFRFAGIFVQYGQVIQVAFCVVVVIALDQMFKRTRTGLAMQAIVGDPMLLGLSGTSPSATRRYAWCIGSVFAAISGILIAPQLGIQVDYMLLLYISAFGAAAIGAFTSIPWTFFGAMLIGVISDVLSDKLQGFSHTTVQQLYLQVPFLVLFLVLILMPKRRLATGGEGYVRRLRAVRRIPTSLSGPSLLCGIAVACAIPYLVGVDLNQYSTGLAVAVIFASLFLLTWTSGQISLCQLGFAAVGAASLHHGQTIGLPWVVSLLMAGAIAAAVGILLAVPTMRLVGIYLAVATFGFGLLLQQLFYGTFLMFGGGGVGATVARPHIFGSDGSDRSYYYVSLAVVGVCFLLVAAVGRSRLGRLLRAMSDSAAAVDAHGVDTRVMRLSVFAISAFFAGIGGALLAGATHFSSGASFDAVESLVLPAILVFCGRRPVLSPVIGAFLFAVATVYKPFSEPAFSHYQGVWFGLLAILVAVWPALSRGLSRALHSSGAGATADLRVRIGRVGPDSVAPDRLAGSRPWSVADEAVSFRLRHRNPGRLGGRMVEGSVK